MTSSEWGGRLLGRAPVDGENENKVGLNVAKPSTHFNGSLGKAGFTGGFPIRSLACIELALRKEIEYIE